MRCLRVLICLTVPLVLLTGSAGAAGTSTGGASVPGALVVADVVCASGQTWSCRQGEQLIVSGSGMDGVKSIEFLGKAGSTDDRSATPLRLAPDEVVVIVPRDARSGKLRARSRAATTAVAPQTVAISGPARALSPGIEFPAIGTDGVFPIRARHDMGQSATNGFGGGRGHQGQDLFAACGAPLVAVRDGTVQVVGNESKAGNYLVLQDDVGQSYVYMHMKSRALVAKGEWVSAGQPVGYVGQTGRANGCHLHFEFWTAPGRSTGGSAVDPLPQLKSWEAADSGHR